MNNLIIYKKARELLKKIYSITEENEKLRMDFAMRDQIRRSAISVVINIAEGYGRGVKHFKSYLKISVGSVNEVIATLSIIEDIYLINTKELRNNYEYLARQISAFANSFPKTN
jgi:four helix bundle protein